MAYIRKTKDEKQLWSNYGYGWECECIAEDREDAKRLLKEYRANTSGQHKIVTKRVKIEN